MAIKILDTKSIVLEEVPTGRHANIIITDKGNTYKLGVGGLPLEGDLQTILEAREAELLSDAVQRNQLPTLDESTIADAKQFYADNTNAKLLFELPQVDLEAEIDNLDLSALPLSTANKLKLLLKALATNDRVFARKQGLL